MRITLALLISIAIALPSVAMAGPRYRCRIAGRVMGHPCCSVGRADSASSRPREDQVRAAACCERVAPRAQQQVPVEDARTVRPSADHALATPAPVPALLTPDRFAGSSGRSPGPPGRPSAAAALHPHLSIQLCSLQL